MTETDTGLASKAMLVGLKIQSWAGSKKDDRVSAEVAATHSSDPSMGAYRKLLVGKDALAAVRAAISGARQHHYANTLPWLDEGQRILPSANYFKYLEGQREWRSAFEYAVAGFVADYDRAVNDARHRLGGLFVVEDYPESDEIEAKFSFEFTVVPLPDSKDFRVRLGDEEEAIIRADIEKRVNDAAAAATKDLFSRCHEAASRMVERLRLYHIDDKGRVAHPFRDTLVENVRELVELLPALNISGDKDLHDTTEVIRDLLAGVEAQDLREDAGLRTAVADEAEAITKRIAEFLA